MGKIDDMRRQREEAFAEAEKRASKRAVAPSRAAAPAAPAAAPAAAVDDDTEIAQPTRPTRPTAKKKETSSKSGGAVDAQGKCPECGKMKPLAGGVMASHQKGFGKACPGSKQKPA